MYNNCVYFPQQLNKANGIDKVLPKFFFVRVQLNNREEPSATTATVTYNVIHCWLIQNQS